MPGSVGYEGYNSIILLVGIILDILIFGFVLGFAICTGIGVAQVKPSYFIGTGIFGALIFFTIIVFIWDAMHRHEVWNVATSPFIYCKQKCLKLNF